MTQIPLKPPSFVQSSKTHPHVRIKEAITKREQSGLSHLETYWSCRCLCLSKPWATQAVQPWEVLMGSRGNFQKEKSSKRYTRRRQHLSARHAPSGSRLASTVWWSLQPRCWDRWRSFCSSRQHQEQGGASWAWVARRSAKALDPKVKDRKEEGSVRGSRGPSLSHLKLHQRRRQEKSRAPILRGIKKSPANITQDMLVSNSWTIFICIFK